MIDLNCERLLRNEGVAELIKVLGERYGIQRGTVETIIRLSYQYGYLEGEIAGSRKAWDDALAASERAMKKLTDVREL